MSGRTVTEVTGTARFSIVTTPVGTTRLMLDLDSGVPIDVNGQVLGGTLQFADGQPTVLTLHLSGAGHVEGEGIVQVQSPPAEDQMAAVADFLDRVDPDALHREAMADPANDASRGIAHAHIATLRQIATGG